MGRLLCFPGLLLSVVLGVSCAGRTPVLAPDLALEPLPTEPLPYRLQAGDTLGIQFWGVSELDQEVLIRPDGKISLPWIDEVQAAGLTAAELDAQLTARYSSELKNPTILVTVRQAPGNRVFVGGEVQRVGAVQLLGELSLLQAVQEVGGFLPSARLRQVLLIRTQADGTRVARSLDLRSALSGAEPNADPRLQTLDIVFVPRTKIANVNLFVEQYINRVFPIGPLLVRSIR